MQKTLFILFLAFIGYTAQAQTTDSIPATKASEHLGETLKIYGTVSGGRYFENSNTTLINVDGVYPNSALTLFIKGDVRSQFSYKPEEFLKDKKILISGTIINYKDKPEVVITSPDQIKVLSE